MEGFQPQYMSYQKNSVNYWCTVGRLDTKFKIIVQFQLTVCPFTIPGNWNWSDSQHSFHIEIVIEIVCSLLMCVQWHRFLLFSVWKELFHLVVRDKSPFKTWMSMFRMSEREKRKIERKQNGREEEERWIFNFSWVKKWYWHKQVTRAFIYAYSPLRCSTALNNRMKSMHKQE